MRKGRAIVPVMVESQTDSFNVPSRCSPTLVWVICIILSVGMGNWQGTGTNGCHVVSFSV